MILANEAARIAANDHRADATAERLATTWDPTADRYDPADWAPTWWCDHCHAWVTEPADHKGGAA
jgi:hypothetical protein